MINIRLRKGSFSDEYAVAIFDTHPDTGDIIGLCKAVTHEKYNPGESVRSVIELKKREAVQLMDDLWGAGVRPSEPTSQEPATQAHLKDMRKIVSKYLKVEL